MFAIDEVTSAPSGAVAILIVVNANTTSSSNSSSLVLSVSPKTKGSLFSLSHKETTTSFSLLEDEPMFILGASK